MVDIERIFLKFKENQICFFTGVPDSLLNDFCSYIDQNTNETNHVIAANEGNAIAIASGYHLATGKVPLVYMQNSGLGNSINPLMSLTHQSVFQIPMILLIGWRGDPEINDWPQHQKQGLATLPLLDILDIPYKILTEDTQSVEDAVSWAKEIAIHQKKAVALVAKKNVLSRKEKELNFLDSKTVFTRYEALNTIIDSLPSDTVYVASTGRITRELYYIRKDKYQSHSNDFLNVGSMGHTLSIALGIALNCKNRLVVCIDGDAASIMHMGSMAITASKKPDNLLHIILNNGVHESVGGQKSVAKNIDFSNLVKSLGYSSLPSPVSSALDLSFSLKSICETKGIKFLEVKIAEGMLKKLPSLDFDHIELKNEFMNNIQNKKEKNI